jgi:hypothetical protein
MAKHEVSGSIDVAAAVSGPNKAYLISFREAAVGRDD